MHLRIVIPLSLIILIALLSNSSQHPTNPNGGYTRAPLDGACTECHTSTNNNLSGQFTVEGIPSIAFRGVEYPLKIGVSNPENDAQRAGFQLVALESDLSNAGDLNPLSDNILKKTASRRTYVGHAPALDFDETRMASWQASWIANETDKGIITFYGAGMIGNGTDGNKKDKPIFRQWTTEIKNPEDTLLASITLVSAISLCRDTSDASIEVNVVGGIKPFLYSWNTGDTTSSLDSLSSGEYSITVTDSLGHTSQASINIYPPAVLKIDTITIINPVSIDPPDGELSIKISGGNPPYEVSWINAETKDTVATGSDAEGLIPGSYQALIIDASGCDIVSDILEVSFTSSVNPSLKFSSRIYPNPSKDYINIWSSRSLTSCEIFDVNGSIIIRTNITGTTHTIHHSLPTGLYILRLKTADNKASLYKIIVNY